MEEVLYKIFLDMHNSYNSLDRGHCREILVVYGLVPQDIHLLRRYWDRLTMVANDRGYFLDPFKVQSEMTQGDPLSPTIFNVAVDAVLQYWVAVVEVN